jgi:hypothetical protein
MTRFISLAVFGGLFALSGASGVCLAEETGAKPQTAAPEAPVGEKSAPAPTKMRSLRKPAPAEAAPAPAPSQAPASKTEIASPDDTVGGLPGAKKAIVEKAP